MASPLGRGAQVRLDGDAQARARGAGGGLLSNIVQKMEMERGGIAADGNAPDGSTLTGEPAEDEVLLPAGLDFSAAVDSVATGLPAKASRAANLADLADPEAAVANLPARAIGEGDVARSLLDRLRDLPLRPQDFGAVGDGVADDGPALQSWWNACMLWGRPGHLPAPAARWRSSIQLDFDLALRQRNAPRITSDGPRAAVIKFDADVAEPNLILHCSGGTPQAPKAVFYVHVGGFGVEGSTSGTVFQIGNRDYSDQHNSSFYGPFVVNNGRGGDDAVCGFETSSFYNCHVSAVCNTGGSGFNNDPAFGVAHRLRRVQFTLVHGAVGNSRVGYEFVGSYSYGNVFLGTDMEELDTAVVSLDPSATSNRWLGGTVARVKHIADIQAGDGFFLDGVVKGLISGDQVVTGASKIRIQQNATGTQTWPGNLEVQNASDAQIAAQRIGGAAAAIYGSTGAASLRSLGNHALEFHINALRRMVLDTNGHLYPHANDAQNMGGGSNRWRAYLALLDLENAGDATATIRRTDGAAAQLYASASEASLRSVGGNPLAFYVNALRRLVLDTNGHLYPHNNGTQNLGGGSNRWLAYLAGLDLENAADATATVRRTGGASVQLYASAGAASLRSPGAYPLEIYVNGAKQATISTAGLFSPGADATQDFGTSGLRWKVAHVTRVAAKDVSDCLLTATRDGGAEAQVYAASGEVSFRAAGAHPIGFYANGVRVGRITTSGARLPGADAQAALGGGTDRWTDVFLSGAVWVGASGTPLKIVGARKTGWALPTATLSRAALADWTQTVSATPTQAEVQALSTQVQVLTRTLAALINDLHGGGGGPHGLIGT